MNNIMGCKKRPSPKKSQITQDQQENYDQGDHKQHFN